jgi:hypothetical protein
MISTLDGVVGVAMASGEPPAWIGLAPSQNDSVFREGKKPFYVHGAGSVD